MYNKNDVIKMGESIYRVLVAKVATVTGLPEYFCIDCKKKTMPKWFSASDLELSSLCTEEESQIVLGDPKTSLEDLGAEEKKTAHERYSVISAVLPFVGDKMQSQAINKVAEENHLSRKTVTNYLCQYLVYQNMTALAPKKAPEQSLTKDQKNIRWALNKFYYTKNKNSLTEAYTMMLKAKYTDDSGSLLPEYPSLHQFKYYYRQNKSLQKEYIRRGGIKDYEMNHRPLLGDGVRQFAPAVGVGMLDATICDIYLCDDSGNLVGRPILVACVDAYSGMCCGYSLLWEGGMYSLRDLMLNCITDKEEWCRQFGIAIDKSDWDCAELPGVLVTDMGTEYKSFNFEQMADLGCRIVNLPSFRPELKGSVEKFFDLIQDAYKPYLKNKGVIEPDFQKRGSHDYRKDASLTIRQFEQIIIHCILYYNNQRIVENFPYTAEMLEQNIKPHASDIWNYGRTQAGANLIEVTREQLILTMLPRASAKFTRKGLQVNKLRYSADGFTEQYLKGGSVTVAYNPEDVGCVWLLRAGEYIRFDLIESRFEGQTLSSVQDLQQRQKALVRSRTEENTKAKVELAQHIEAIASHGSYSKDVNMKGITKTRQRQKEQRHKDFTQELNQGWLFMDKRINFAEMLPKMLFGEELIKALTYLPKYDASIRNADPGTRLLKLTDIYKVFLPGQMATEIYHKLYMMTSMSLSQKGTIASVRQLNANRSYMNGGDYHGVATGATSATVLGSSGVGKTTCIQNAVNLLGDIIETEKPLHKIVPVVMVSTPFDCNYKGLLCQILMSIDEALGTNYYEKSQKASINAQQILGMVSQVCNQYIGTLIIDEIQFIVQHKSGSQLYRMILQLINTSCNILLVGTNECLDFFTQSHEAFQMARRSVGLQYGALEFSSEFRNLCKILFSYQYVQNESVLTEGLMTWLYEHSAGNPSTLVTLIHDAQEIAILEGRETLGLETLTKAYNNRLQMLHGFINPGLTKKSQTSSKKEIPELPVELLTEKISAESSDSIIEEAETVREEATFVSGDPETSKLFEEADTSEVTNKEYVSIIDMVATAKKQKFDIIELMKTQFSVMEVAV